MTQRVYLNDMSKPLCGEGEGKPSVKSANSNSNFWKNILKLDSKNLSWKNLLDKTRSQAS